ncbi:hypothetical protein GCM10010969_23690 [Saccharibacillus kuerlensis]|uniref:Glycoside hydrolase 35 catalytic domain-containing protein n=1 Tax=Saccharibacillus kuerlensis TaxID=459527 RepID=A0ABQ2L3L4_9BACL|nr:hypothetical protein GCM10010969_23690 [Saccharibacillus kuerlensis]
MRLRCADPSFLAKLDAYFDELLPRLRPLLCTNGGPLVALQIENEYGSYGSDSDYLKYLRDGMIRRGMDVLLFTFYGPETFMLRAGSVEGALATVNFGWDTRGAFDTLRRHQLEGPLLRQGENELIVLEMHGFFASGAEEQAAVPFIELTDRADLG